jgi:adenylyl-sulfate kinase
MNNRGHAELLSGHNWVVWLTGLSGAGKTTVAHALRDALTRTGFHAMVLDGDDIRAGLNADLGFSAEERRENLRRIAHIAKLISSNGFIVIVATISPRNEDRDMAREIVGLQFREVYVDTPLEVCEQRDVKGLYRKARAGALATFTGVNDIYEAPARPDLTLHASEVTVADEVELVLRMIGMEE